MDPVADEGAEAPPRNTQLEPESTDPSPQAPRSGRRAPGSGGSDVDTILTWGIRLAVVAVVLFAAYFGYTYYRGQQQARLSDPSLVLVDQVRKLVDAKPNDPALRARFGEALAAAGDNAGAKAQLAAAIKLKDDYAAAYQDLAQIAILEKDYTNAEKYLQKLLELTSVGNYQELNDRREFAFFGLGEIAIIQERWVDAIGYLNAAIRIRKDASDSYLRLAQAYHGNGDDLSAMQQVDIALEFDPRFPEAHYFRGTLYLAKGDKVDAAWDFRASIDSDPKAQEPKDALAALGTFDKYLLEAQNAFAAGDLRVAVDAVSIARSIQPTSYAAAMLHGRILEQSGDAAGAVDAYTTALKLQPSDAAAAAGLKRAQATVEKEKK